MTEPTCWIMTTPEAGNRIIIWTEAEANRFRDMDGRTVTPLYLYLPVEPTPDEIRKVAADLADDWAMPETEKTCAGFIAAALMAERVSATAAATPIVDALRESIASHRECASYKGDFLREKHGDDEEADAHEAALNEYLKRTPPVESGEKL